MSGAVGLLVMEHGQRTGMRQGGEATEVMEDSNAHGDQIMCVSTFGSTICTLVSPLGPDAVIAVRVKGRKTVYYKGC